MRIIYQRQFHYRVQNLRCLGVNTSRGVEKKSPFKRRRLLYRVIKKHCSSAQQACQVPIAFWCCAFRRHFKRFDILRLDHAKNITNVCVYDNENRTREFFSELKY